MANRKLRDLPSLERVKESSALIGLITAAGHRRKATISRLVDAQERENPLTSSASRVELVSYTAHTQISDTTDILSPNPNNLAIRQGTDRHSFDDGYAEFEFVLYLRPNIGGAVAGDKFFNIPASIFNAEIPLNFVHQDRGEYVIQRASATSFLFFDDIVLNNKSHYYLKAIYGIRKTLT